MYLKRVHTFFPANVEEEETDANYPIKSVIRGRTLLDAKRRRHCKVLNNGVGEAIEWRVYKPALVRIRERALRVPTRARAYAWHTWTKRTCAPMCNARVLNERAALCGVVKQRQPCKSVPECGSPDRFSPPSSPSPGRARLPLPRRQIPPTNSLL